MNALFHWNIPPASTNKLGPNEKVSSPPVKIPARLGSVWTEDLDLLLAQLWADDGLSAWKIAAELGHGISKNAVIGRAHRMGLKPRRSGFAVSDRNVNAVNAPKVKPALTNSGAAPRLFGARPNPTRPLKAILARAEPAVNPGEPAPGSRMLGYFEPNDGCKFLFGDERDIFEVRVCGAPAFNESSWCMCHWRATHSRDNGHLGESRPDLAAQNRRNGASPIVLAVLSDREERSA